MKKFTKYRKKSSGFPLGENVKNCKLVGYYYIPTENTGKDWWAFQFDFRRGTQVLNKRFYFGDRSSYESDLKYWRAYTIKKTQMERILLTYFSREEMREANKACIEKNVYEYFMRTFKLYKEKDVVNTPVVLKVIKSNKGYLDLPMFGEFIRKDGENGEDFEYSDFEKKIIEKYDVTSVYGKQESDDIF